MDLVREGGKKKESKVGEGQQREREQEEGMIAPSKNAAESNRPAPMTIPTTAPAAQLTIFYAGAVSVYDAVPPEKAQAIMFIAAAAAAAATAMNNKSPKAPITTAGTLNAAAASPVLARSLSLQSSSAAVAGAAAGAAASPQPQLLPNPNSSVCKLQAELPIARRHSLQRFLEKRRDRLVSKAPYPSAKMSDGMETAMEVKLQIS